MNKKLIAIIVGAVLVSCLILVAVASCAQDEPEPKVTETETEAGTNNYIPIVTDESGNTVTTDPETDPETENDINEDNPVFTEIEKKVIVISAVATVRSATTVAEDTGVAWPKEGAIYDATGESENWYRIIYKDEVRYIAKNVVGDTALLEGFTAINDQVTVSTGNEGGAANVRSFPSADSTLSIRGQLAEGAVVTRVAVGEKWSKILFEVASETETDAEGKPVKEQKEYYISNDCLKTEAATEAATEETNQ